MKNSIILLIVITGLLYASPVDLMIGSRGFSMGGAYSAVANDATAAYWNPAGLAKVETLTLLESNWILQDIRGLNINYFTAAIPIKNVGTISGSWLLIHANLEEGWDEAAGKPANENSANENIFSISIGRTLWEELGFLRHTSIGISLNRYALTFSDESDGDGAGLGFDIGTQIGLPKGFSLAFMARNLGTEVMGVKIDPEIRWGLGFTNVLGKMHRLTVDVDATVKRNRDYEDLVMLDPSRRNIKVLGGIEYGIILDKIEIDISGGINTLQHNSRSSHNFSGGLGLVFDKVAIRYGFGGNTEIETSLGFSHRVAVSVALGKLIAKE